MSISLVEADKAYLSLDQIADQPDKVGQGPAHMIELPDHDHIAGAQLTKHPIERRTLGLRATGDILIVAFAAGAIQCVHRQVKILVLRARASVAKFHLESTLERVIAEGPFPDGIAPMASARPRRRLDAAAPIGRAADAGGRKPSVLVRPTAKETGKVQQSALAQALLHVEGVRSLGITLPSAAVPPGCIAALSRFANTVKVTVVARLPKARRIHARQTSHKARPRFSDNEDCIRHDQGL